MFAGSRAAPLASILSIAALVACRSDTREGALLPAPATANEPAAAVGRALAIGAIAPAFSATDADGRERKLDSLCGPNGVVLLFFRSADW